MIRAFLTTLLFAVLLCSCAKSIDMGPGFKELSTHFAQAVRWQDFPGAAKFIAEEERDAFLKQFPRNKDLHMTDVRYERVAVDEETGEAETILFVEYYMLPSVTIKEWRWTQKWARIDAEFPKGGFWQIESPAPDFP